VTFEANCSLVRASTRLIVCALILGAGPAWAANHQGETEASHGGPLEWHLPPPPTCASHENPWWTPGSVPSQEFLLAVQTPGAPPWNWLYTRYCGPATVRVHLNRTSTRIHGGRCVQHDGYSVRVGLAANPPARPAEWVGLFLPRNARPGTLGFDTARDAVRATIQLRGPDLPIAGGTITIRTSMRAGTFALRLRDGTPVTGSWTCG